MFWRDRIKIRTPDMGDNILSLSGGNQQKALFARALASDARDHIDGRSRCAASTIATKLEVYELIRAEARGGRTFLWYTTETEELKHCDHVYIFRNGAVVAELARDELSEESVIHSSFAGAPEMSDHGSRGVVTASGCGPATVVARALPALSLALVIAAIAWLNPRAISYFGFTLMLNLAVPIALATMAQMFVIAGNDLDLSIGTFVGFVCCVSRDLAAGCSPGRRADLIGCVAVYAALGALIYLRNLPSIVVTLGMSFVWQGLAILGPAEARRQGARVAAGDHGRQAAFRSVSHRRRGAHRRGRLFRAHAHVLRRDPARLRRQRGRDRAGRLVAAEGQNTLFALAGLFGVLSGWRWSASRPRPTPISAMAIRCCRSPA